MRNDAICQVLFLLRSYFGIRLIRHFAIPDGRLPGSLSVSHIRRGKPSCHCARPGDPDHPIWACTFTAAAKKRTLHIPRSMVEEVQRRVAAGRQYQEAVRDVLAANAELLALARKQAAATGRRLTTIRSSANASTANESAFLARDKTVPDSYAIRFSDGAEEDHGNDPPAFTFVIRGRAQLEKLLQAGRGPDRTPSS